MENSKVLIVDDDPKVLYSLELLLQGIELELFKASSGQDALSANLEHDFALIIMDVKMPVLNGYEVAEMLRNREKNKHVPIIFLSAHYTEEHHIFKGYESGAVDFLVKPVKQEVLINKVRTFVELDQRQKKTHHSYQILQEINKDLNGAKNALESQLNESRLQHQDDVLKFSETTLKKANLESSHKELEYSLRLLETENTELRQQLRHYFEALEKAQQEIEILIEHELA